MTLAKLFGLVLCAITACSGVQAAEPIPMESREAYVRAAVESTIDLERTIGSGRYGAAECWSGSRDDCLYLNLEVLVRPWLSKIELALLPNQKWGFVDEDENVRFALQRSGENVQMVLVRYTEGCSELQEASLEDKELSLPSCSEKADVSIKFTTTSAAGRWAHDYLYKPIAAVGSFFGLILVGMLGGELP
ncbi:hypothetical protein HNP46_000014 [Pseudomonas nitritireducens]|uniref:Uncharacterized protein n=1 Tax=Pseudomonas nitroreducens TaxID=46680 RepID=A0A7W7NY00_PSENT|nr:hypothetical protein [Pseudomonas nitritireducens]MBB4861203.1 hypothetical protein [Pseudomonas nitritireducens]